MIEIVRLAYKYKLCPKPHQEKLLAQFGGCCRFVWNYLLFQREEEYHEYLEELDDRKCWGEDLSLVKKPTLLKFTFMGKLQRLKEEPQFAFLKECNAQILQQKALDLYQGFCFTYDNFRKHVKASFPKPKKKGRSSDSFRYPQGFKIDGANSRVYLPKIGWLRYRNSRDLPSDATPKNITITHAADGWYMSVQFEKPHAPEITEPDPDNSVGIDMGSRFFATLSDGTQLESFNKHLDGIDRRISLLHKKLDRSLPGSSNRAKLVKKLALMYKRKSDIKRDRMHKYSTKIVREHNVIVAEDLQIKNITKSAKGTVHKPGKNIKVKSTLNRMNLNESWGEFFRQIGYKMKLKGGVFVQVHPKNTSRTCPKCGCISKKNRPSQPVFKCVSCGYSANADVNAACNILRAGRLLMALQGSKNLLDPANNQRSTDARASTKIRDQSSDQAAQK